MPAGHDAASEITIINTCTVTQKASMQSRQAVRQAIRANPNSRIVVTGCYAQTEPRAFEKIDGVHYIIGNADKHCIAEVLAAGRNSAGGHTVTINNDIRLSDQLKPSPTAVSSSRKGSVAVEPSAWMRLASRSEATRSAITSPRPTARA